MASASPLLLDISRTISRLGTGSVTGIDRVERAYVRHALDHTADPHFLTRVLSGIALLDGRGMRTLLQMEEGGLPRRPDFLGYLSRKQSPARRRAETAVRRLCRSWGPVNRLDRLLEGRVSSGFRYINTGHLNVNRTVLTGLRSAGAEQIAVMIHDTIPLDHPEFSRPVATERFRTMLADVSALADVVICNSGDTRARLDAHLGTDGPPLIVAPLGVDPPVATGASQPDANPYFVTLGTIEPRKNHHLLLSIWETFHEGKRAPPHLHIIGRRGWENREVFDLLDTAPFMGASVFEHNAMDDAAAADLIAGARALLFPSHAEGFGYPLFEALQLGTPVIASDLPVFRELLPSGPVYLDPTDRDSWAAAITAAASRTGEPDDPGVSSARFPAWADHFGKVFRELDTLGTGGKRTEHG